MDVERILAGNLAAVRQRIAEAARRAGRRPAEAALVAVTKNRPIRLIEALLAAGQRVFGENRVQEALPKIAAFEGSPAGGPNPEWHLIGHLQGNKAKPAAQYFTLIHSADSERILAALDRIGREQGKTVRALLQVNTSGEAQKSGCSAEEAHGLFVRAEGLSGVRLEGLMTMAALVPEPELARPSFRALRVLRDQLLEKGVQPERLRRLSMGMSSDFEVAVEEGATLVRVGSALFQGL